LLCFKTPLTKNRAQDVSRWFDNLRERDGFGGAAAAGIMDSIMKTLLTSKADLEERIDVFKKSFVCFTLVDSKPLRRVAKTGSGQT